MLPSSEENLMSAKVITITSGKGGVGKTTAVANLGVSIALEGKRVVVLDADIGLRNLDVVMGLENRIVYDIVDVVEGRCRLQQALIKDRRVADLRLFPAAQTRDKTAINPEQMAALCDELRQDNDFVLIDSPAGIEQGFQNAIAGADEVIVMTTPEVAAVRDADRVIGLVEAAGKGSPRLIINRIKAEMVRRGDMLSTEDVIEILAVELIGIIPEDENIVVSINKGTPIALDGRGRSGLAFRNIARRILGTEVPFMALDQSSSLVSRVMRLVRKSQEIQR
jgi:septum site-determining protein MinD